MESILLDTPTAILARLGWDPDLSDHDRKRSLARTLIASRLAIEHADIRVVREPPAQFGFHTHLLAEVGASHVPLRINTASLGEATVVGVAEPTVAFGFDVRDASEPDADEIRRMRSHSRHFADTDVPALVRHWSWIRAVGAADGRELLAQPLVQLDPSRARGWVLDRHARYDVVELSHNGWTVTVAHGLPTGS